MKMFKIMLAALLLTIPHSKSFAKSFSRSASKKITGSKSHDFPLSMSSSPLDYLGPSTLTPFSLSPLDDVRQMMRSLNMLPSSLSTVNSMPMDVKETEHAFEVLLDLPGVKKEDIHINVNEDSLTITAERSSSKKEENENIKRTERYHGRWTRTFPLPENVDENHIQATNDNGVLTITLPKTEKEMKSLKKVEVK